MRHATHNTRETRNTHIHAGQRASACKRVKHAREATGGETQAGRGYASQARQDKGHAKQVVAMAVTQQSVFPARQTK